MNQIARFIQLDVRCDVIYWYISCERFVEDLLRQN